MAFVPFWLKISSIFAPAGGSGLHMSAPESEEVEWEISGDTFLLGVFLLGILTGISLASWCAWKLRVARSDSAARTATGERWIQVVLRAVRFVRKRHRVSLAFSNYRNHRLRTGVSRPKAKAKARPNTPPTRVLREGPVFRHGSVRGRATGDEHVG